MSPTHQNQIKTSSCTCLILPTVSRTGDFQVHKTQLPFFTYTIPNSLRGQVTKIYFVQEPTQKYQPSWLHYSSVSQDSKREKKNQFGGDYYTGTQHKEQEATDAEHGFALGQLFPLLVNKGGEGRSAGEVQHLSRDTGAAPSEQEMKEKHDASLIFTK